MQIKTTLTPGQNGTKQLLKEYGNQLVRVRYRYDKASSRRYKTVELIVDEKEWIPGVNTQPDQQVLIRVGYGEMDPREKVKAAGGYWDAKNKAWNVAHSWVMRMGLDKRIIFGETPL